MNPDSLHLAEGNRKARPWLLVLALTLSLLFPHLSFGGDLEVSFDEIAPLGGSGPDGRQFLPGDEIQVSVRLRILQATGNPFVVRLRITGDGWHEILTSPAVFDSGVRVITFGTSQPGLFVGTKVGKGKVSLLLDIVSEQDTVTLQGRRHAYLNIQCPKPHLEVSKERPQTGAPPYDMALTADDRYLYVTRDVERNPGSVEEPKVTVIGLEARTVVPAEIEYSEAIELPKGVAASPNKAVMYIVDFAQALHVVDAETHVLQETIDLNPDENLGRTILTDVAVNQAGTEAYVADSRGRRILVVDLDSPHGVREELDLNESFLEPPTGSGPVQVMTDPDNSRFIYVLCSGLNEVIKLDVVSDEIVDFVRLRDPQDPASFWPAWSMALNPFTDEIYVVLNPGELDLTDPLTARSRIIALPKNRLGGPGRKELLLEGSSIRELVVRQDGLVYAIDSYRGEILVIDMESGTEMTRCAIPVEPGGGLLRTDSAQNRLFVAGWLAGFVNIVE